MEITVIWHIKRTSLFFPVVISYLKQSKFKTISREDREEWNATFFFFKEKTISPQPFKGEINEKRKYQKLKRSGP